MKYLPKLSFQILLLLLILGSCTPDPIDECTEYLETVDGQNYFGSLIVCENDMPQIGVSYPGYADVSFENSTAIVRTNFPYISPDTITTIYKWRFSRIESGTCHIILKNMENNDLKGVISHTILQLFINPGVNCGDSDEFRGNYL